jgi:hypothetical protein
LVALIDPVLTARARIYGQHHRLMYLPARHLLLALATRVARSYGSAAGGDCSAAEPTVLIVIFASLCVPARPVSMASSRFAAELFLMLNAVITVSLFIVALAENGLYGQSTTHLLLTMIHEAMILEHPPPRRGMNAG